MQTNNNSNLQELWGKIKLNLIKAAEMADSKDSLTLFFSFIDNNELELAWDELYFYNQNSTDKTFWTNMYVSAERMKLKDKLKLASTQLNHLVKS